MGAHGVDHYFRIYQILVGLFLVSFVGPFIGEMMPEGWFRFIFVMTTAFVVAVVKAWLVAKHFMHITVEKRFIHYAIVTALVFMGLFVAVLSVDMKNHEGQNWKNVAAQEWVAKKMAEGPGDHHGGDHGDAHGGDHGDAHGDDHAKDGDHAEGDHGKDEEGH